VSTTAEDRALVARIGAQTRWGLEADRVAATAPARKGLRDKFEREADPEWILSPAERARRADSLFRAHMLRMSLKSKRSRRQAAELLTAAEAAEAELAAAEGGGPSAA